jgi:HSP20 family protein
MLLTTFDPFTRDFDRIVERAFGPAWVSRGAGMPMDAVRTEGGLVLRFDLPGVDPASIEVTVDRGVLTVAAKRSEELAEGEQRFVRERSTGSYTRRIQLGDTIDADQIEAGYDAGVLTVKVPFAETAKPRKVEIQSGAPKGISA